MQHLKIADATLREDEDLSFKEKIKIAKKLDALRVDVIEIAKIKNKKTDVLFLHTIAPLLSNSIISCTVDLSEDSVCQTAEALAEAKSFRLRLEIPVSSVQMEYLCQKKPKAILEMIASLTKKCKEVCANVEFAALDATRSESEFLRDAINIAIENGATLITLCDTAGEVLPSEYDEFIKRIYADIPALNSVMLGAECSNTLNMASASIVSAAKSGVSEIKTSISGKDLPSITSVAKIIKAKGERIGISSSLNYSVLEHTVEKMGIFGSVDSLEGGFGFENETLMLTDKDDISTVSMAVSKLGYDLSEEDLSNVYEEFLKVAKKKKVGTRELDVIVASAAVLVKPTYKLKGYTVNSGNIIDASCIMTLVKDNTELKDMTLGSGPVDAAFQCIEKISGIKSELDDFQIHSVTEGKEAVGVAVVKLRYNGKLYSGKGVSTDIVEAGINAYLNALNKICFEEV